MGWGLSCPQQQDYISINSPRAGSLQCVFGAGWEFEVRHKEQCLSAGTCPSSAAFPPFCSVPTFLLLPSHLSTPFPPFCCGSNDATGAFCPLVQVSKPIFQGNSHLPRMEGLELLLLLLGLGHSGSWTQPGHAAHVEITEQKSIILVPLNPDFLLLVPLLPQSHNAKFKISMGLGLLLMQKPHCWTKEEWKLCSEGVTKNNKSKESFYWFKKPQQDAMGLGEGKEGSFPPFQRVRNASKGLSWTHSQSNLVIVVVKSCSEQRCGGEFGAGEASLLSLPPMKGKFLLFGAARVLGGLRKMQILCCGFALREWK